MPYLVIRGNLASYSQKTPFRVMVSGLKGLYCLKKLLLCSIYYYYYCFCAIKKKLFNKF